MARRSGRKGDYLATDSWTGATVYASQLRKDYWGQYSRRPLERNLQEISSPLNDPEPVIIYYGPSYERIPNNCIGSVAPTYIGVTTIPTRQSNAAFQALNLNPGIGSMEIGCSFFVR